MGQLQLKVKPAPPSKKNHKSPFHCPSQRKPATRLVPKQGHTEPALAGHSPCPFLVPAGHPPPPMSVSASRLLRPQCLTSGSAEILSGRGWDEESWPAHSRDPRPEQEFGFCLRGEKGGNSTGQVAALFCLRICIMGSHANPRAGHSTPALRAPPPPTPHTSKCFTPSQSQS